MSNIDRDNPHTPESTTHWVCDESVETGCCACINHDCKPMQNTPNLCKPMPEQKPSGPFSPDKAWQEWLKIVKAKKDDIWLRNPLWWAFMGGYDSALENVKNMIDRKNEESLRQLEQERKEGV